MFVACTLCAVKHSCNLSKILNSVHTSGNVARLGDTELDFNTNSASHAAAATDTNKTTSEKKSLLAHRNLLSGLAGAYSATSHDNH